MKISGMFLLAVTTLLLVTTTIFASLNVAFGWVFLLTVLGQVLFIFTVYKILRDDYSTDKTFADFYEDRPVQKNQ
jgi:hypothetical protein